MKYSESEETYLETIYLLKESKSNLRSVDLACELGYSKPSICNAMKRLREKGHVIIDESGVISLTDAGNELAKSIYERHYLLTMMFISIGAEKVLAEENACRIEHVISQELVEIIRSHLLKSGQAT